MYVYNIYTRMSSRLPTCTMLIHCRRSCAVRVCVYVRTFLYDSETYAASDGGNIAGTYAYTHTYEELSQELFTLTERQQQQQKIKKLFRFRWRLYGMLWMRFIFRFYRRIFVLILFFFRSLSHVSECQLWCIEFVLSRSAGISHLVTHTIGEHSRNSSHDHVFRISIKKTKCGVASYQSTQIAIPKWIAILNRCQSLRNLKLRQQLNSIWFAASRSTEVKNNKRNKKKTDG